MEKIIILSVISFILILVAIYNTKKYILFKSVYNEKYPIKPLWRIRFETYQYKEPNEFSTQICANTKEEAVRILINNTEYSKHKEFRILTVEEVKGN